MEFPDRPLAAGRGGAGGIRWCQFTIRLPRLLLTRTGTRAGIRAAAAAIAAMIAATGARAMTAADSM